MAEKTLSDEALADLLAKAGAYNPPPGLGGHEWKPRMDVQASTVSALVREVQAVREQVEALTADNAALVDMLTKAQGDLCVAYCIPRDTATGPIPELLAKPHPGAALLAEVDGLRKQVEGSEAINTLQERALDALRARVAELEATNAKQHEQALALCEAGKKACSERDVERAMRTERESLLAGAREREAFAEAAIAQAVAERDAAQQRAKALEAFAEAFAVTAEDAVANAERPKGGQQVPFHGDFARLLPSDVARMKWWAREARNALKKNTPEEG